MKIAIFHNFLDNIGGAEIATLYLAQGLDADIYTTNIDPEKIKKMGFSTERIFSIGQVPVTAPWRHELTYWRFRFLNLKQKYDFYIISGDWAVAAAVNHRPNAWYIYSPMRELWDLASYTRVHIVPWYNRIAFDYWVLFHRYFLRRHVRSVDTCISISQNVQARVKKFLGRDSPVIYPPVDISKYYYAPARDYWLSVNRLITHKRVHLQLDAFRALPEEKLIIVGSYEQSPHFQSYAKSIRQHQPSNVELVSWVDQRQLINLYSHCKGFITTALDEDFGLTVVEAMASGKPVIAPNDGGYKETILDGVTGKLVNNLSTENLIRAITDMSPKVGDYSAACVQRAKDFDVDIFIAKFKGSIGYDR